ncbi:MAG: hypothetical protein WCF13_08080 [Stellaceae bacterium]
MLAQAPQIEFELEGVAEEPGIAVDDNHVERSFGAYRRLNHLLKRRPLVVSRARAALFELLRDGPALGLAISFGLPALVGNG